MERCEVFWILLNAVKGFFDKQLEQRGIREHQRDVTLIVNPFSFPLICHAFLICLAVFRLTQGIFRLRPLSFSVWFMFGSLKSQQWMVLLAVIVPDLSHVFHCFLCACVFFALVSHFQLTVLIGGIYWGWGHWDTGTSVPPPTNLSKVLKQWKCITIAASGAINQNVSQDQLFHLLLAPQEMLVLS